MAQVGEVKLSIESDQIGLGGMVRPGTWTPIRLTLQNAFAEPVTVRCQWTLQDADDDVVLAQRTVTLSAQRTQSVWLYADPPLAQSTKSGQWFVHIINAKTGQVLAMQRVVPGKVISPTTMVVGTTSTQLLGLQGFGNEPYTQQERKEFLRGLTPAELPDRWYGLSLLDVLVWTPDAGMLGDRQAGDPNNVAISSETRGAIVEWVRRGGHLVIVMPGIGDPWATSPFKELVGPIKSQTVTDTQAPRWLGEPLADMDLKVDLKVIDPGEDLGTRATVLLRDTQGRPTVVARQVGLGRVTFLGVDITDPRYLRMGLPSGKIGMWHQVLMWRGPIMSRERIEEDVKAGRLLNPEYRRNISVDGFMAGKLAMRETAVVPLTLAALLFTVYWIVAGPVSFLTLKRRDMSRHNWLAFTAVTGVCTLIAWGGAMALRPSKAKIAHFSVVDIDVASRLTHTHSWASVFVPVHGNVEFEIVDPAVTENRNTISTAGISVRMEAGGFLDPQRYEMDAAAPHRVTLPFRSTAKAIELDYMGRLDSAPTPADVPWVPPVGTLRVVEGWPVGTLTHKLPGTLRNALVIYQAADGREPWVWRLPEWEADKPMVISPPRNAQRLVIPPGKDGDPWRGHLGGLMSSKVAEELEALDEAQRGPSLVSGDRLVQMVEMLSFYDTLPPPRYTIEENPDSEQYVLAVPPVGYQRTTGRRMDLSRLLPLRRVIIIGHLQGTDLPVPLHVDGERLPAHPDSWTVIRWVTPLLD